MTAQGCQAIAPDMSDLQWTQTITYGEALNRIRQRLFAEFWRLPDTIYDRLIADTQAWIGTQPEGADTVDLLKPYLVAAVFITPS